MTPFQGRKVYDDPGTLMQDLAEDTILISGICDGRLHNKYGPGQYLPVRLTPEHQELLKGLTAEDLQHPPRFVLWCAPSPCSVCRFRYDKNGVGPQCTQDSRCPWVPGKQKRSNVYCFSGK